MNFLSSITRLVGNILATLVVATVIAGCSRGDAVVNNRPPEDPGQPVYGGIVTMGLEAETNTWLPGRGSFASPGANVALAVFDPLVRRDHTGNPRPYLAESITPNDDFTIWTLRLRPGVRFHDGTVLDSHALKWNFDHLHKNRRAVTFGTVRDIAYMQIVDELTVAYHLTRAIVPFPDLLNGAVGWPVSPTAVEQRGEEAGSFPIGTGPFRFVSWRRHDRVVVERNPDYWQDGLPYLDGIVFRPMSDEDSRLASLISRNVDAMHTLRHSIVDHLHNTPGIHVYQFIGNAGDGSIFNTRRPPVDDVRIRRSMALAMDQPTLIEVLGGMHVAPEKTQFFSEASPWWSPRVAAAWPRFDIETARALLQDYIYDANRSDGKPPGTPVEIDYICPPGPSLIEYAQMYQAFWNAAGYRVRLRQVDQATQIQMVIGGDYMVTCWRSGNESDPFTTLSNNFGPPDEQPLNFTNFVHPAINENLEILRIERDFQKRFEAVERIMLLFAEQVPSVWAGANPTAVGVQPYLRNIDGWMFPDGTRGDGTPGGVVTWGQVWRIQ
jgi:peptide/nickel transport system substrate-binding protein